MPSDDAELLSQAANATDNFYILLGIAHDATEAEIKRAYRKTSLQHHPDKHPDDPHAAERFHLLGVARDVLLSPDARSAHNRALAARRAKAEREEQYEGKRRKLKEQLEARERGAVGEKRKREEQEAEIQRLAEDGKRRKQQLEKERRRTMELSQQDVDAAFAEGAAIEVTPPQQRQQQQQSHTPSSSDPTPEIDRTLKVRWPREAEGPHLTLTSDSLKTLFSCYGAIENVFILKDKRLRPSHLPSSSSTSDLPTPTLTPTRKPEKVLMGTAAVIFATLPSATRAHADARAAIPFLDSVTWASKDREAVTAMTAPVVDHSRVPSPGDNEHGTTATPSTPSKPPPPPFRPFPGLSGSAASSNSSTSRPGSSHSLADVKKPAFSFSPAAAKVRPATAGGAGPGSPGGGGNALSQQEATMARLKARQREVERRRMEEEIRRREAAEEGTEARAPAGLVS